MKSIEFDKRRDFGSQALAGTNITDGMIYWIPEIDNIVSLRIEELMIISRILSIHANIYQGEVINLITFFKEKRYPIEVGDIIKFSYDQIFSCWNSYYF